MKDLLRKYTTVQRPVVRSIGDQRELTKHTGVPAFPRIERQRPEVMRRRTGVPETPGIARHILRAEEAIRNLRYQLLHAAAATLIEAAANEAEMGLFLIHEFWSASLNRDKLTQNATDWENFVHAFPETGTARIEKNQILGPVSVPGGEHVPRSVPLYLGKLVTELK